MDFGTYCWCNNKKQRIFNIFVHLNFLYVAVNIFIGKPKIVS
jgi:hypothetical protein